MEEWKNGQNFLKINLKLCYYKWDHLTFLSLKVIKKFKRTYCYMIFATERQYCFAILNWPKINQINNLTKS